jgi:hypothetical protein
MRYYNKLKLKINLAKCFIYFSRTSQKVLLLWDSAFIFIAVVSLCFFGLHIIFNILLDEFFFCFDASVC